ncbi:hypothetical protein [Corynebacterium sp. CCM 9203]|uniref:hypothetical protein n=1 Tax=Corynebacterium sp. CCM 9203 TaxID=3057615 RepID=UPI00352479A6
MLVVLADRGDQVRAFLQTLIGDAPGLGGNICLLDTNGGGFGVPDARMPGSVAVSHELTNPAIAIDLVVGGSSPRLPHLPEILLMVRLPALWWMMTLLIFREPSRAA